MVFSEKAIKDTWLETHDWKRDPETGHCIVPTHGDIPNMAIPMYSKLMGKYPDSYLTGLMDINPKEKKVVGIHFVLVEPKGKVILEYEKKADIGLMMPVNDEDGTRLYTRLSECAESYTADHENFFEAFMSECRGGAA